MKTYTLYRAEINYCIDKDWVAPIWRSDCWPTKEQALEQLSGEAEAIAEQYDNFAAEEWSQWIKNEFKDEMIDSNDNMYDGGFAEIDCHVSETETSSACGPPQTTDEKGKEEADG